MQGQYESLRVNHLRNIPAVEKGPDQTGLELCPIN